MNPTENVQGEEQDAENALLDGTAATRASDGGAAATRGLNKGDRVRRRLSVCLFLHIVGVTIISQVYPKVGGCCGGRTHMSMAVMAGGILGLNSGKEWRFRRDI